MVNRKIKYGILLGILVMAIILLYVNFSINGNIVQENEKTIKIGGLFGLTGYSAEWGEVDFRAAQLAIEEANSNGGINGKRIDFIIEDTKSDLTSTVSAFSKLVEINNVNVIIGPTWSEFTEVVIPLAEEKDILLISGSAGGEFESFKSENFFDTWPSNRFEMIAITDYMKSHDFNKTVLVYDHNAWSESTIKIFKEEAARRNIKIIDEFQVSAENKDFKTVILKLKQKGFDSIFVEFGALNDKGIFIKQVNEQKIDQQIFSASNTESIELKNNFGPYIEGIIYPSPEVGDKYDEFASKYEKRYGSRPETPNAATTYDAANAVIMVLKKNPKNNDELISFLLDMDFEGASNRIKFDQYGLIGNKKFITKTFRNGSFVKAD